MTMAKFIPTKGNPPQDQAATSAPPVNLNEIKGTNAPTNMFRKGDAPPPPAEQQQQPQP
jgi:hypothetical protein